MSTMKASHGHSEPCCNIPPIVTKGYSAKGSYEEIDGFNSYATGPTDAKKGIIFIMDVFGFYEQTLQGADILATSDDHQKYRVLMPDWFKGEPMPLEWYPPTDEDKQKKVGGFFQKHSPPSVAAKVVPYVDAAKEKYPEIQSWAIMGLCWGGKVATLVTSSEANPFSIAAEAHPAMIEPGDAKTVKVPFVLLASGDEPVDKTKEFEENLSGPKHVEIFGDQIHGWMGARADLANDRVKDEYTRGYKTVLEFWGKNWH